MIYLISYFIQAISYLFEGLLEIIAYFWDKTIYLFLFEILTNSQDFGLVNILINSQKINYFDILGSSSSSSSSSSSVTSDGALSHPTRRRPA